MNYSKQREIYRKGLSSYKINNGRLESPYTYGSHEYNLFERGWIKASRSPTLGARAEYDDRYLHEYVENGVVKKLPTLAEEEAFKRKEISRRQYLRRRG